MEFKGVRWNGWGPILLAVSVIGACDPTCTSSSGSSSDSQGCGIALAPLNLGPTCSSGIDTVTSLGGDSYRLTGHAPGGAPVRVLRDSCGGTSAANTTADGAGVFTVTVTLPQGGQGMFYASVSGDAGNAECCDGALASSGAVVDNRPPQAPTGVYWRPDTAFGCRQVISGLSEPGVSLHMFSDATCTTPVPACAAQPISTSRSDGTWVAYTSRTEPDAEMKFYARAVDLAENESPCSAGAEARFVPPDAGASDAAVDDAGQVDDAGIADAGDAG